MDDIGITSFVPLHRSPRLYTTFQSNNIAEEEKEEDGDLIMDDNLDIKGVTLKMAFDMSNAVADNAEIISKRFTDEPSLDLVHKLRRCSDAVLVGRGTVERDDCTLTVRRIPLLDSSNLQPVRVIIDPYLKLIFGDNDEHDNLDDRILNELKYSLFKDGHRVIIYHLRDSLTYHEIDIPEGVSLQYIDVTTQTSTSGSDGIEENSSYLSPSAILKDLNSKGIYHIMVEGGPATAQEFLKEKVVDRAIIINAPVTFDEPVPSNISNETFQSAGLQFVGKTVSGNDVIQYWTKTGTSWPTESLNDWPR